MSSDLTVHIVDDEEPFRKSLTFLLASAGFAVSAHESAAAFLALLPLPRNLRLQGRRQRYVRILNAEGLASICA